MLRLLLLLGSPALFGRPAASQGSACGRAKTTFEMQRCLSLELKRHESKLSVFEDSVSVNLDDSVAVLFRQAHVSWMQYREQQCEAVRAVFFPGTMAPVMQLQCLLEMTDQRLLLLRDAYSSQL